MVKLTIHNCNKNDYERNLRIAESLRSANLLTKYVLALQHTDSEVLKNIRRKNLSPEEIQKNLDAGIGYNALTGEYVDMIKAGVVDPVKVTRLAFGLPVGGSLEYADKETLNEAIKNRNEMA